MKSSSKVLLGLVAGAAAGAIMGLLLAPETGQTTRKKVLKSAKKLNESIKTNINEFSSKSQKALKDLSESAEDLKKLADEKIAKAMHNN